MGIFDKETIDRVTLTKWGILKCYLLFWKYQAVYLDGKLIAFINIEELK